MTRIGLAALVLAMAACASGDVGGDFDAGGIVERPDATAEVPDAAAGTPDAAAGTPDAAAGTPDAEPPPPDAEPPPPDADPLVPPTVLIVTPPTGGVFGGEAVVVTGSNFESGVAFTFGSAAATCTFVSSTTVNCTTPAGTAGFVGVTATQTSGADTLTDGFLYWDTLSGVDDCNLAPPTHADGIQGLSFTWQARVNEAGITNATTGVDLSASLIGQIGYGPAGTNPATTTGWTWFDVSPTAGYGPATSTYQVNYDQYEVGETMPSRSQYAWSARFSVEAGVSWKFCGTGTMTARLPIACTVDGQCFGDEKCIDSACRVFCDTATQCYPWGEHCSGLGFEDDGTTFALFCDPGGAGGATGATCTSGAMCVSGFCLVDLTDTCTAGCDSDALCPPSDVCTEFSGLGLCSTSCGATADCAAGHSCIINVNFREDRFDQLCLVPDTGTDPIGASCPPGMANCESGLCLNLPGGNLCTGPCNSDADCAGGVSTCGLGALDRPSMVGTQTLDICVP